MHSCDTFFYNVGNRLGIDRIAQYADMVGYGHKTGIDLPHEAEGLVPSSAWKIRNFRERWYPSETISVAIGQGATTVTPLQMAVRDRRNGHWGHVVSAAYGEGCSASDARAPRRGKSRKYPKSDLMACTAW